MADELFLKGIGLKRKVLSRVNEHQIRGVKQAYFKQIGTITVQTSYGSNTVGDKITIVDGNLAVPLLIRWNIKMALRKDMTYPKTLNQIQVKQGEIPTYIQVIPEEPNEEQIEKVKQKMIAEFQGIF